MIYEYNSKVVNKSNDFFDEKNFVGYILPDGSIYACQNHNITNVYTFIQLYLKLLDIDYKHKDEMLNVKTNDKLAQIVLNRIKQMSHDEIHALLMFVESEIILSDILVCFFKCHLITRLKKQIITSEIDHSCFYNYLLHDFEIVSIPRVVYDEKNKKYRYVKQTDKYLKAIDKNKELYDEINNIKKENENDNIGLFYK